MICSIHVTPKDAARVFKGQKRSRICPFMVYMLKTEKLVFYTSKEILFASTSIFIEASTPVFLQ
jgi:hypothetical protein